MNINTEGFIMNDRLIVDLASNPRSIRGRKPVSKGGLRPIWLARLFPHNVDALRAQGYTVADVGPRRFIGLKEDGGRSFLVAREKLGLLVLFCNWERVCYVTDGDVVAAEDLALRGYRANS